MKKYLKSMDGMIYLNVHDKARALWGIVDLFVLWEKENINHRINIATEDELLFFLNQEGRYVCMEIGHTDELIRPSIEKWNEADKITHNGYLYIRCNDILD